MSLRGKSVAVSELLADRTLDRVLDELTERAGHQRGTDGLGLARWDLKAALIDALDLELSQQQPARPTASPE